MDAIEIGRAGAVAIVTLKRPEKLNTITTIMLDELDIALSHIEESDAEAVVITGAGRAFCGGSDLSGSDPHLGDKRSFIEKRIDRMHDLILRLLEFRQPSIAAINGLAYGGGLEIALACTFRIAAPSAKLCLPEIGSNHTPCYGGTQMLSRLIGNARALQMMLTGEAMHPEEAARIGLVNLVDPDPLAAAERFVSRLPNGAGLAQQMIRRCVGIGTNLQLAGALDLERQLALEVLLSQPAEEAAVKLARRLLAKSART